MSVSPKFLCWNLIPNVKILGGGAFGRGLDHGGSTLMGRINVLKKRQERMPLSPFAM
jgi:hypothetical protein